MKSLPPESCPELPSVEPGDSKELTAAFQALRATEERMDGARNSQPRVLPAAGCCCLAHTLDLWDVLRALPPLCSAAGRSPGPGWELQHHSGHPSSAPLHGTVWTPPYSAT